MAISLASKSLIGIDVLRSWQRSPNDSLAYEVRVIMLVMAKWKPEIDWLPTLCTEQNSNLKHSLGEIAEVSTSIQDLKDVRAMDLSYLHLIHQGSPCKKQVNTGIWWWATISKWQPPSYLLCRIWCLYWGRLTEPLALAMLLLSWQILSSQSPSIRG